MALVFDFNFVYESGFLVLGEVFSHTNKVPQGTDSPKGGMVMPWSVIGNIRGPNGEIGADGLSAYQVAVFNGFVGTESEWLASLIGEQGDPGDAGLSAYEVAVENGFVGDEAAWLASLVGAQGDPGDDGLSAYEVAVDNGFVGNEAAWLASLVGEQGDPGATGTAATVTAGSTTTGAAGSSATVTNSGTSSAAVFDFTIPRGDTGLTGATGATGPTGVVAATTPITYNAGTQTVGIDQTGITIAPSQVTGTAVITSDARLSDARTPTAHAASHASGGADAVTLAQSQVTNLTTDLAAAGVFGPRFRTGLFYPTPLGALGTVQPTLGQMRAIPFFVQKTTTFDRIGIEHTTAPVAGLVGRLGIYADDGAGYPQTLVLDAGTIDLSTSPALKTISINQTLQPGVYWLTFAQYGGATTTVVRNFFGNPYKWYFATNAPNNYGFSVVEQYSSGTTISGALPATFGTVSSGGANSSPYVLLRAA